MKTKKQPTYKQIQKYYVYFVKHNPSISMTIKQYIKLMGWNVTN